MTGLISLLLSLDPTLEVLEIREIVESTAEDMVGNADDTEGWDQYYGHGRINAFQALMSVMVSDTMDSGVLGAVSLYPNPISNGLISLVNVPNSEHLLEIFDPIGKKVWEQNIIGDGKSAVSIQLGSLISGAYFIRIQNVEKETIYATKVVVK